MDRIETGVRALSACVVLAFVIGCSGGISLAGDGDDEDTPDALAEADATEAADVDVDGVPDDGVVDAPDTGDGDTCPGDAISGGSCATAGATCRTAAFCQQCAIDAWTWYSAYCWCAVGSWNCTHADCFPYDPGTYSDSGCTVLWGADGDADADGDPDADAGADADADVGDCVPPCPSGLTCYYGVCVPASADADADADADAGSDADGGTCAGGWMDDTSDLCWQHPTELSGRSWDDAVTYCDGLVLGGHDDWYLPTITEMRSLIRGCPATVVSSPDCGVSDWCVPCGTTPCEGCGYIGGPGEGGCYWDDALGADCEYLPFWTASATDDGRAWYVYFSYAALIRWETTHALRVRCVRPGP